MSWYRARSNSSTYSASSLSSPPPLSPVHYSSNVRIQSSYSPVLGPDRGIPHLSELEDNFSESFFQQDHPTKPTQSRVSLPSFRSLFGDKTGFSDTFTDDIDVPNRHSDTDDDSDDIDEEGTTSDDDVGHKYYRVSSERGRWKTDPLPIVFQRQRLNSLPVPLPPESDPVTRPSSEPAEAHSTSECHTTIDIVSSEDTSHVSPEDKEDLVLSPLPPSSPPLSPVSSLLSPVIGPVSPLLLSSPSFPTFSIESTGLEDTSRPTALITSDVSSETISLLSTAEPVISHRSPSTGPRELGSTEACEDDNGSALVAATIDVVSPSSSPSSVPHAISDREEDKMEVAETKTPPEPFQESSNVIALDEQDTTSLPSESVSKPAPKRKRRQGGGARKRARLDPASEPSKRQKSASKNPIPKRAAKKLAESESESDSEEEVSPSSIPSRAALASTSSIPTEPDPDPETTGMLIEAFATSRASSLPVSSLYKALIRSRPSLKDQKTKKEWCDVFLTVLSRGHRSGHGVFGKVESSGKDDADRPLESQWFYVPENDQDQERAALIRSMLPGKRTETKKYKQYYYQPLGKISRWDPEDDL